MDETLHKKREYLVEYLGALKQQQSLVAHTIQIVLDETQWQLQVLDQCPAAASAAARANIGEKAKLSLERTRAALPPPPQRPIQFIQLMITTSSISCAVAHLVFEISKLNTPETLDFAGRAIANYEQLQRSHRRHDAILELLIGFNFATTRTRLDGAGHAYNEWKAGRGDKASAVISMRALAEALQGELINRARYRPGEKMKWNEAMVERLLPGPEMQLAREQLLREGRLHNDLVSALSAAAKDRDLKERDDLPALWATVTTHLFVVMMLVRTLTAE